LYPSTQITVVDANWITHAPRNGDDRIDTDRLNWVIRYWTGEPYNSDPVWEHVATGVSVVLETELRRRCFEVTKQQFPEAHIPILMARLGSEVGTRGGLIAPFLRRLNDTDIELLYLMRDAEFHDAEVIREIAAHADSGFLGRLMAMNEAWKSPDFRPWGRMFKVRAQHKGRFSLPSVHQAMVNNTGV